MKLQFNKDIEVMLVNDKQECESMVVGYADVVAVTENRFHLINVTNDDIHREIKRDHIVEIIFTSKSDVDIMRGK